MQQKPPMIAIFNLYYASTKYRFHQIFCRLVKVLVSLLLIYIIVLLISFADETADHGARPGTLSSSWVDVLILHEDLLDTVWLWRKYDRAYDFWHVYAPNRTTWRVLGGTLPTIGVYEIRVLNRPSVCLKRCLAVCSGTALWIDQIFRGYCSCLLPVLSV